MVMMIEKTKIIDTPARVTHREATKRMKTEFEKKLEGDDDDDDDDKMDRLTQQ